MVLENKLVNLLKMKVYRLVCVKLMMLGLLLFTITVSAQSEHIDIEWTELIPADDLKVLLNPPDFLLDIEDRADNDNMNTLNQVSSTDIATQKYKQALESTRIVDKFDGKSIRMPGFIVPIEIDDNQKVTQFFIVPYFGACLHMPPPPPNQMIFVHFSTGIELSSLYDAFWFEGVLTIDTTDSELGKSAYSMLLNKVYPYEE